MKQARRKFLLTSSGSIMGLGWPWLVDANTNASASSTGYPSRPVHITVGFPAGGPVDMFARITAQCLSEQLGQPFVVDNRPGAGGNIGTEAVVRSAPDGYTLLMFGPVNTINTTLYKKLPFNFSTDILPVAGVARVPLVMVVNPSVPARTVGEFIDYAKQNRGRVNFASGGNGTPHHVAGELFRMLTGIEMVHVPYRGSAPALNDLLGGQVQVMFDPMPSSIQHVRSGKLRALAVTTVTRSAALPGVPTVAETVPAFEAYSWYGVGAPTGTPSDVVSLLNREVNHLLAGAKFNERLVELGGSQLGGSSSDLAKLVASETDKWRDVIREARITLE